MLHQALLVAAALTATPTGDAGDPPLAGDFAAEHVILSCSSPLDSALIAPLGPVSGEQSDVTRGDIELVEAGDQVMIRRRMVVDGQRVARTLNTRHVAGGQGEPFYHMELKSENGGPAHLFFTINADRSGQLMWSTSDSTVETSCLSG